MGKVKSLGQVAFEAFYENEIFDYDYDIEHAEDWQPVANAVIREYLKRQKAKKARGKK